MKHGISKVRKFMTNPKLESNDQVMRSIQMWMTWLELYQIGWQIKGSMR